MQRGSGGGVDRTSQLMTSPEESICFIFWTRRARVSSFLASEYQTMNSFLCVKDNALSFCAECLLQRYWSLDLSLLIIRFEGDGHYIARSYACIPPCIGIHNDVLLTTPVPNGAAPSVAIDGHFDGHPGFAPDISRVEWQCECGTCVLS